MGDIVLKGRNSFCLLAVISVVASCSLIAPMTTTSTTAKQLGFFKTTVEAASVYYTDKTATDHVVSVVLKKDCKIVRVAKREKICHEIEARVYDVKNESKMNISLSLVEADIANFNQNYADDKKKVEDIKNNVKVLKNHNNETLAHNVLNNRNVIKNNSDNSILADNLSSVYSPSVENTNKI